MHVEFKSVICISSLSVELLLNISMYPVGSCLGTTVLEDFHEVCWSSKKGTYFTFLIKLQFYSFTLSGSWQNVASHVFVFTCLRPQKSVILQMLLFKGCLSPHLSKYPYVHLAFMDWCKFSLMSALESLLILISPAKPHIYCQQKAF